MSEKIYINKVNKLKRGNKQKQDTTLFEILFYFQIKGSQFDPVSRARACVCVLQLFHGATFVI